MYHSVHAMNEEHGGGKRSYSCVGAVWLMLPDIYEASLLYVFAYVQQAYIELWMVSPGDSIPSSDRWISFCYYRYDLGLHATRVV